MLRRSAVAVILGLLVTPIVGTVVASPAIASACGAGLLDGSFGSNGKVQTAGSLVWADAFAAATDAVGRTIVVGQAQPDHSSAMGVLAARFLASGSLDPSFGVAGVTLISAGDASSDASGRAVAVQPDGKIVIAGELTQQRTDRGFGMWRLDAGGQLDPTFGSGGRVFTELGGNAEAHGVALMPDGTIAVAGEAFSGADFDFVTARYLGTGQIDPSFAGGPVWSHVGVGYSWGNAVLAMPDGGVVVAGQSSPQAVGSYSFTLLRYGPTGISDSSFGQDGVSVFVPPSGAGVLSAVALSGDRIVAAGSTGINPVEMAAVQYDFAGHPDPSFGQGGLSHTDFGTGRAGAKALAVNSSGGIVLAGNSGSSFGVARLTASGAVDTAFAQSGLATVTFGSDINAANAVTLDGSGRIVVAGVNDLVDANGGTYSSAIAIARLLDDCTSGDPNGSFIPLPPARVLDTRLTHTPVGPNSMIDVQASGRGGVPGDGVAAVVVNLTATEPTAGSYLTAYPTGGSPPLASNLNFGPGQTIANQVVAKLGSGGKFSVYNAQGTTHVIADVVGWYSDGSAVAGDRYTPVAPARILDTRTAHTAVGPNSSIDVQAGGKGLVPATGVSAIVVNLTATEPTAGSYLTAYPTGGSPPVASNLNFGPGQTVPSLVVVKLGTAGKFSVYNAAGDTQVIADVVGWYSDDASAPGANYTALPPSRILDTRTASPIGPNKSIDVQATGQGGVPATGVSAVVVNLTATEPTAGSYLTAYPTGGAVPVASNLNFGPGQTVPNLVVVKLGTGGKFSVYNAAGDTQVIADVVGWY